MASIPILHLQASLRPPSLHGERAHVGPSVHHRTLACSPRAHLDLGRAAAPCSDDETVPSELESQVQSHGRDVSHQKEGSWNVGEWSRAGLVALAAAALCYTDPALAYKGGGPYGIQVTRGQDLSGQDFSGKTLIKQDFKTSILRQANFKGAKLLGASFFDADLTGADLSDADLRGADFSLAQVQKANLSNAILEGALVTGNTSFKNSNITGADFTDVYWREDQKAYLCKVADGVNPVTGNATRDTLFCD